MANVIIIKGRGDKAFCAGGDVAALVNLNKTGPKGKDKSRRFFALEYQLDHVIATYTKPYVAFMDGITQGGGVGLSVHAPFRIATERTDFAMPETGIGFLPDVGASFFLPRLDGKIGTYLGLTGNGLKGVEVLYVVMSIYRRLRQHSLTLVSQLLWYCNTLSPFFISSESRGTLGRVAIQRPRSAGETMESYIFDNRRIYNWSPA